MLAPPVQGKALLSRETLPSGALPHSLAWAGKALGSGLNSIPAFPQTVYLGFCPVCLLWLSPDPLFQPWGSATVKLDHFFPDVIILHTLGYRLCLNLMKENRRRLWATRHKGPHALPKSPPPGAGPFLKAFLKCLSASAWQHPFAARGRESQSPPS